MKTINFLQVLIHPLGLAGLALFLVFGVLSRKRAAPRWWPKAALSLAAFALVGGLGLAFFQVSNAYKPEPGQAAGAAPGPVNKARTEGDCAPAMAGVSPGLQCPTKVIK
ncbi:MAG: hypothetical protein KF778_22940 [Rhodocyclaceae bacterium]|nr:hypothetical protein [Rhodocyclaceae bacterium]